MPKRRRRKYPLPAISFRARVFAALVGISATTSLVIGLVLYYFAQDRLLDEERASLAQRSRTANAAPGCFWRVFATPRTVLSPLPSPMLKSWSGRLPTQQDSRCST